MDHPQTGFAALWLEKRAKLIARGIDPYPYNCPAAQGIADVIASAEERGNSAESQARVAGRIWSLRKMGKTWFVDLRDFSGKIQLYFKKDALPAGMWELLPLLDLGDIISVEGPVFRTRTGELSIRVADLIILSKVVVPIPIGKETADRAYYRAKDPEIKYRERYLHWILNEGDRKRIFSRSKIISCIRRRMEEAGFLEVATPTVEFIYGGAEARPFRTSVWALDNKAAFLRISPELYLKRYIVAGFQKVFSICQNFRNEGIDHSHNPEFTMMEWYEEFTDYEFQMTRFENLVADVCREICGATKINYQEGALDFTPPWRRLTVLDSLKEYAGVDAGKMTEANLAAVLRARGIPPPMPSSWGTCVMALFEKYCEEQLVQPTFVLDHPVEISPLTKKKRGDARLVERFEPYAWRMEIGNAYSELTDPVDQLDRLVEQQGHRAQDQEYETHPLDSDFIKAIGCGMPPTGGVGLGIDRLIMLLTNAPSIRDVIPFPMIKPRGQNVAKE